MLRSVTTPLPPPPAGELRKVDLRYRCSVCGMEIRLTMASEEDPEPPTALPGGDGPGGTRRVSAPLRCPQPVDNPVGGHNDVTRRQPDRR